MSDSVALAATELLRKGCSDERVQALTGLTLLDILELRAHRAAAPTILRTEHSRPCAPRLAA